MVEEMIIPHDYYENKYPFEGLSQKNVSYLQKFE